MEEILLDVPMETTPEDLLPIIENLAKDLMDRNDLFVGEIEVKSVSRIRRVEIDVGNGTKALVSRTEKSSRPENIGIVFFGTLIGVFDVIQTSHYPSVSQITGKLLVSPDSFKISDGLGGFIQAKYVMNFLVTGIQDKIRPYYKADQLKTRKISAKGPYSDTLERTKKGLGYWLDGHKSLNMAAGLAGIDDETMLKHIPDILDQLDESKRDAWISKIKSNGKRKYLGKYQTD